MTIKIREAVPSDYEVAGRVTARAYREFVRPGSGDWETYLDRIADVAERAMRTTIIVAVQDGRIVGSVTLELEGRTEAEDGPLRPEEAHIRMLGVDPDARGHGIGPMLMRACEDRARDAGRTMMTLHTTERMRAARAMYEALGYERQEDRVFPDGFVLLGYAKELGG
jgi:ribosomal protein S18 acetylase RimI-like enzyme